jgi:HemY protein
MLRVLTYVVAVFVLAAGFAWLADRPGDVVITWQGYEIRTSLIVAAVAVAIMIGIIAFVGAVVRMLVRTPRSVGHFIGTRRRDRGYRALSRGMIAVGAGDARAARRAAQESQSLLGMEPLVLLLSAQAAQIAGDTGAARTAYESLAENPETRVLGLHGLFIEARRQGEHTAALHFAEEAAQLAPRIAWAGAALFEYRSQAGDWSAALATLSANSDAGIVEKDKAQRLRAVLITARAMELEAGHPDEARLLAVEAHRLAPDLVPAAITAARLLARNGEVRRATRLLEAAWKVAPHPDVADAYGAVRPGDSVRDRLKRVRRLVELRANNPEGAMAVARAAIDARDWPAARSALGGIVRSDPTERVCLLMAEIEEGEHGDQGRARSWLKRSLTARRDPVWTADGHVFDHWAPVSPISGRVDAFEWRVVADPLAAPRSNFHIDAEEAPIIDPAPSARPAPEAVAAEVPATAAAVEAAVRPPPIVFKKGDNSGQSPPVTTAPPPDDPGPHEPTGEDEPNPIWRPASGPIA